MSTEYGFKRIGDVELIEAVNESANVIIEDAGVLKKMAAKSIGAVKTVNGVAPDADGNVAMEISTVSSWNDLEDKPFYDAGSEVEIPVFENADLALTEEEGENGPVYIYEMSEEEIFELEDGCVYNITIDDETYVAEVKPFVTGFLYLGNIGIMAPVYGDSGECFLIAPNECTIGLLKNAHSISIKKVTTAIEKELVTESDYVFAPMESDMIPIMMNMTSFDFSNLESGNLLNITFDGVDYTNITQPFEDGIIFGNLGIVDIGENTGEPYLGMYMSGMGGMYAVTKEVQKTFSIDKILEDSSYENIMPVGTYQYRYDYTESAHLIFFISSDNRYALEDGANYRVIWEGTEYTCTAAADDGGMVVIGNRMDGQSSEPFAFAYSAEDGLVSWIVYTIEDTETHQIQISAYVSGVKKLDKKYIPSNIELPTASYNKPGVVKVYSVSSGLNGDSKYLDTYLDSDNKRIYAKMRNFGAVSDATADNIVSQFNILLSVLRNAGLIY